MKSLVALLAAAVIVASVLSACGDDPDPAEDVDNSSSEPEPEPAEPESPEPESPEPAEPESPEPESPEPESPEPESPESPEPESPEPESPEPELPEPESPEPPEPELPESPDEELPDGSADGDGSSPEPTAVPYGESVPALVTLPADEAPHDVPIEWWYFNGFLTDDAGNDYNFHYVAFQGTEMAIGVPHLVRVTFGSPGEESHNQAERIIFTPVGPAPPSVDLDSDGWVMRGDGDGNYQLAFDIDAKAVSLSVSPARAAVLHYEGTGLTDFGPDAWAYYYSYTRQAIVGSIEDESGRRPVSGASWYDHQWGRLDNQFIGWDWFGLNFDDGSDLMITVLRELGTDMLFAFYGTYVSPEGDARHLAADDLSVEATRTWTSESTGVAYPVAWTVTSDLANLDIEVTALQEYAEFEAQVSYWEGAINASGTHDGQPVSGRGFAELVGYDPRQQDETTNPLPVP